MDEIYDDLENYNEIDTLDKLRCENKELKDKLDEYATSIDKLQKDFDNLTSEYRKLEYNYSSLLKTARAEVERKTQIITNINKEKDMLIVQAYQNGNKRVLSYKNNMFNKKSYFKTKEVQNKQTSDMGSERTNSSIVSVGDKPDSTNIDTGHKTANVSKNEVTSCPLNYKKNDDTNEGDHQVDVKNSNINLKELGSMDRRKSVYSERSPQVKFSSDEECDSPSANIKKQSLTNKMDRYIPDRNSDKYVNKSSEPSRIRDRSYIGFTRDITRNDRNDKPYDNDRYKRRDRYESSQRYRRHVSPERSSNRSSRNYPNDNNQRLDPGRVRASDSPPKDHYYPLRKQQGTRSYYERYHQNYEQDRFSQVPMTDSHSHPNRNSFKYKRPSNFDEPYSKRMRHDLNNERYDVNRHEREFLDNKSTATVGKFENQERTCQSPDFVYVESKPIKEIMCTASVQLEDPRTTSKKYSLETSGDKLSCAVNDSKSELILIDKRTWTEKNRSSKSKKISERDDLENNEQNRYKRPYVNTHHINEREQTILVNNIQPDELSRKLLRNGQNSNTSLDISCKPAIDPSNILENLEQNYKCSNHNDDTKDDKRKSPIETCDKDSIHVDFKQNTDKKNICVETKNGLTEKPFTFSGVVEGDLELSNESFDNTNFLEIKENDRSNNNTSKDFSHTNSNGSSKSEFNPQEKDHLEKKDSGNNALKDRHKNKEKLRNIKISTEKNKKSESTKKRDKSKKKTKKSKDEYKYFSEEQENHNIIVKRISVKKEKIKESKTKIQDIFGESSCNSLITPDDLGISNNHLQKQETDCSTHFCENAQDTIALKENNFTTETSDNCKLGNIIDIKHSKTNEQTTSVDDPKPFEINDQTKVIDTSSKPMITKNLETSSNKVDLMKTVISSSEGEPEEPLKKEIYAELSVQNDIPKNHDINIDALATSTPYKELLQVNYETNCKMIESGCNFHDVQLDNGQMNDVSTMDGQAVTDVPDVRIFIRRKRKSIKKPSGT